MDQRIGVAIIGAGDRGRTFTRLISEQPDRAYVAAVAEPRDDYRDELATSCSIPPDRVFRNWQELLAHDRLCDAVVVATQDQDHVGPAVAATDRGYHLLLEKPMAVTLADCQAITDAQTRAGTITTVCHSLRYHPGLRKLKEVVESGRIGSIVSLDQIEQVGWWHHAHSYVRGNWGNRDRATFMLLAKSCHDIDYIAYLVGEPCERVQSFGSLTHFTADQAPGGVAERCVDCAREPDCRYSAIRHYVTTDHRDRWPANVCSHDHSEAAHRRAIETGPYGRCVWHCDNDVVDHQVVAMEFATGITATFTMTAFTRDLGRELRIHGTAGEIRATQDRIEIRDFAIEPHDEVIDITREDGSHGGGDRRVLDAWLQAIAANDPGLVVTDVHESLATHTIVFAAEQSRLERSTIELANWRG